METCTYKHVDTIQCPNCKCWRELKDFIGKRGNTVKNCIKCRDKDARYKQNPEVQERIKERHKKNKYYEKYREKKRTENEEEYLQHNAENMKKWREKQ